MATAKIAFISYTTSQRDLAAKVCEFLEGNGCHCWIAPRDMGSGRPYGEEILAAIGSVAALIVILSERAAASPHVRRELEAATSCNVPLLPLVTEPFAIPDSVRYYLGDYHRIEATGQDLPAALDRLLQGIHTLAGDRILAEQQPGAPHQSLVNPLNLNPRMPHRFALLISQQDGGSSSSRIHPLGATRITVGRSLDSDIVISNPNFSGMHFSLNYSAPLDTYVVNDSGTANGVFLNGCRVKDSEPLDLLDLISVGETTFEFIAHDSNEGAGSSG